jgi:hypothetical protein
MPEPTDILDYASPRPHGRYRLPSVSRLDVRCDGDGLVVVETLRGKGRAIFAMVLGVATLFTIPYSVALIVPSGGALWRDFQNPDSRGPTLFWTAFMGGLWLADAIVLTLVFNNTWRKTILEARDGTVALTFQSPLGKKVHRWPFEQILELGVDRTLEVQFIDPRFELLLRSHGGQLIHLFADHKEEELERIAAALKEKMGWPTGAMAGLINPPFVQPPAHCQPGDQ